MESKKKLKRELRQDLQVSSVPNVSHIFPKVNVRDVKYLLTLPEVKAFGQLAILRAEIEEELKTASPRSPSGKWFIDKDKKLAKTQYTLSEVLYEGDKFRKVRGSDDALEAAFVVVTGGARL